MGLLSHIESIRTETPVSEKQGLLHRAESIHGKTIPAAERREPFDFHDFANEIGLRKTAILVPYASRFFMRYAHGFDAETILKSVSTADFWNGTFPGIREWQRVDGTRLEPYYQLFSSDEIHRMQSIYLKSFPLPSDIAARAIMLIADEADVSPETMDPLMEELADCICSDMICFPYNMKLPRFETFASETDPQTLPFTLFFSDAIAESVRNANTDQEAAAILEATVFSEIYVRLCAHIGSPDRCIPDTAMKVKLYLQSQEPLDADIILFQCKKTLASVLGKAAQLIRIA